MRLVSLFACLPCLAFPAFADAPNVATDIPPVHGLVARVMAGVGAPDMVVPANASAHSHDLRPSAAAALQDADIVFWMGEAMTPWLEGAVATLGADAKVISLLAVDGTALLPFREEGGFGEDDGHDHGDDHGHEDGAGSVDPHAWLNPDNATLWLDVIADTLAEVDPENADAYRANAEAGQAEIAGAVRSAQERLAGAGSIRYAVFHDAYQYFETRFGLKPVGAVTLGDAASPGPARIARLQKQLQQTGADCLLVEAQNGTALVEALQSAKALKIVEIDPMGAALSEESVEYPALLASLAESFDACR